MISKMKTGIYSLFFLFSLIHFGGTPSQAELRNYLEQNGITWTFDKNYESGQFANGDYWVAGDPVVVQSIVPAPQLAHISNGSPNSVCTGFTAGVNACASWCQSNAPTGSVSVCDGSERGRGECHCSFIRNGWEVNPIPRGSQGFDSRAGGPNAALVPSLPYHARPGETLVNSISGGTESDSGFAKLKMAAALTVLAAAPKGGGADYFRPPYVGTDKPLIPVSSLQTYLLPSLAPVTPMPTLEAMTQRFTPLQMDHMDGLGGRNLHPYDSMPNYGADMGLGIIEGASRLMMSDPISSKKPLIVAFTQYGIDLLHVLKNGGMWTSGGGHRPGMKLPVTFAATLLNNPEYKALVQNASFFHEDLGVQRGKNGSALYGFYQTTNFTSAETLYWNVVMDYNSGFRSHPDPYGLVDGGHAPGTSYQGCCTSNIWKGEALALHLLPEMKSIWSNPMFFDYVDRWVEIGAWSQPDVCAPFDGNKANYKITFGPDPARPGDCIRDTDPSDGVGRFPNLHGSRKDGSSEGRYSDYIAAMWKAYRGRQVQTTPAQPPLNSEIGFLPFTNVFNPTKEILTINLAAPGENASLIVYDKKGGEVRRLIISNEKADWDGRNSSGQIVASGTYLVVLKSGNKIQKKKVVVVK